MSETLSRQRRKLSAILMVDVSGFSRMMGGHEERTIGLIQDFHRRVREAVEGHEGRVVDTAGDSVFGEFDSVVQATRCARTVQESQASANAQRKPEERFETRIGVHLGDVVLQEGNVYGDGVNITARLESIADPGSIFLSDAVYQQVHRQVDFPIEDLGSRTLKNIAQPVHVYRVPAVAPTAVPAALSSRALLGWLETLRQRGIAPLAILGLLLVSARFVVFPTGGVFPTFGSILLGAALGTAWAQRTGRRALRWLPVGAGIATGAVWTDWSTATNFLFVMSGLIVATLGFGRRA